MRSLLFRWLKNAFLDAGDEIRKVVLIKHTTYSTLSNYAVNELNTCHNTFYDLFLYDVLYFNLYQEFCCLTKYVGYPVKFCLYKPEKLLKENFRIISK